MWSKLKELNVGGAIVTAVASLCVALIALIGGCNRLDRIDARVRHQEELQRFGNLSGLQSQFDDVAASIDGVQSQIDRSIGCSGVNADIPGVRLPTAALLPFRQTGRMRRIRQAARLVETYRVRLETGYYEDSLGGDDCEKISADLKAVRAAVIVAAHDLSPIVGG